MSPYLAISFAFLVIALNGVMLDAVECNKEANIYFLIDSSGSIGDEDFQKSVAFVDRLEKDNDNIKAFQKDLINVEHLSPSTDTHTALELIDQGQLFSSYKGDRSAASKILIIITDGLTEHELETIETARKLKERGFEILTIGIGPDIDRDSLEQIATSREDVFAVNSYDNLESIELPLTQLVCEVAESK